MAWITFRDYLGEIGTAGQASIALFITGITYAALVHLCRLGFRYRMAFFPFAFLPLMTGVYGLCDGTVGIIQATRNDGIFDGPKIIYHFGEILQTMSVASLATAILLCLSFLLFLSQYTEQRPK